MCRSIKCLANFEPPASEGEIRESAVQPGWLDWWVARRSLSDPADLA